MNQQQRLLLDRRTEYSSTSSIDTFTDKATDVAFCSVRAVKQHRGCSPQRKKNTIHARLIILIEEVSYKKSAKNKQEYLFVYSSSISSTGQEEVLQVSTTATINTTVVVLL